MSRKIVRILFSLILVAVCISGSNIIYKYYLTGVLKGGIYSFLKKSNIELVFSTAEIRFPLKMVLDKVLITDNKNINLKSERVEIYLNLLDILKKDFLNSVRKVTLEAPQLFITGENSMSGGGGLDSLVQKISGSFKNRILFEWDEGDIYMPLFNLQKIDGTVQIKKNSCSIEIEKGCLLCRNNSNSSISESNFKCAFFYDFDSRKIDGNIRLDGFDLSTLNLKFDPLNTLVAKQEMFLKGYGNINLDVKGTVTKPVSTFTYSLKEAQWNNIGFSSEGSGTYENDIADFRGDIYISDYSSWGKYNLVYERGKNNKKINVELRKLPVVVMNKIFSTVLPLDGKINCDIELTSGQDKTEIVIGLKGDSVRYKGDYLPGVWSDVEVDAELEFMKNKTAYKIDRFFILSDKEELISFKTDGWNEIKTASHGNYRGNFNLDIVTRNITFNQATLLGNIRLDGNWEKGKSGVRIVSRVELDDLWLNQHLFSRAQYTVNYTAAASGKKVVFESVPGDAGYIAGEVDFTVPGAMQFKDIIIKSRDDSYIALNGRYDKEKYDFVLEGKRMKWSMITEIMNLKVPFSGLSDFSVSLGGTRKNPEVLGKINITAGELYDLPFSNIELQCVYRNNTLKIPNIKLVQANNGKEEYVIAGMGEIPISKFSGDTNIEFSLALQKGDLSLLEELSDSITAAKGSLDAQLKISGTMSKPLYKGYVVVSNGNISFKKYISKLENLNVDFEFNEDRFSIEKLSGRIGKAVVQGQGYVIFAPLSSLLESNLAEPRLFNIKKCDISLYTLGKRGVKIIVPELVIPAGILIGYESLAILKPNPSYGEPNFAFKLSGENSKTRLSGFVQLENTHFSYPPPKEVKTNEIFRRLLGNTDFDIELKTGKNTWFENKLISMNINGMLKLEGVYPGLIVNGRIESQRGSINYISKVYDIKDAVFEIINNEIFLQATAETPATFNISRKPTVPGETSSTASQILSDYDQKKGTLQLVIPRAPIGQVQPMFMSRDDFNLSQESLNEAALGYSENLTPEERQLFFRQQAVRLIDSTLTTPIARSIIKKFGLEGLGVFVKGDMVYTGTNIKDSGQDTTALSSWLAGMKYTIGTYVGNLIFGYSVAIDNSSVNKFDLKHEIQAAYKLRENVMARYVHEFQSLDPSLAPDNRLIIEPYWRFGWDERNNTKESD